MDNLVFEKVYQDDNLIELKISANSEYVSAYQFCYVDSRMLRKLGDKLVSYGSKFDREIYLEFGSKQGKHTPAFSMRALPADAHGHVKIEVDVEIADNEQRFHRCCFYVNSEIGLAEGFGGDIKRLADMEVGEAISLNR